MIFWATRYSAIFVPPSPSSVTFSPAVFGGFGVDEMTFVPALATPTSSPSTPISASVRVVTSFFLAAMMPLKDGKRGLDGEHAVVGLALAGHLAALDGHLAQVRELGQAQVLGDDGRNRTADAVGGLIACDDQLGALDSAERAGQRPTGLHHVGPVQTVVEHVYGLVGAHRQRLADRLGGALGSGGQHGHRRIAAFPLLDQQRLFDSALVDLVEHGVGGLAVKGEVAVGQLPFRPRVRDLLDQDHDVRHESGSSSSKGTGGRPPLPRVKQSPPCYSSVT